MQPETRASGLETGASTWPWHTPALTPPRWLKRIARVGLGEGGYEKIRFLVREWFPVYLPRYLDRRRQLKEGQPGQLDDLYIFLTNQCNARCGHCFYIEELGYVPGEMRLPEYERLAPTLPAGIKRLTFTGGEALLHPDCEEILALLSRSTQAESIVLITNGFVPSRVERICRALLEEHRIPSRLDILVSLDGLEETHNAVRGNDKAWERANETLSRLSRLKEQYPRRFDLGVITIIQKRNYEELEALNEHVITTTRARHGFEFIRGTSFSLWGLDAEHRMEYNPAGAELPPPEEWDNILAALRRMNRRMGLVNQTFHLTNVFAVEMLRTQKNLVNCVSAGENVGVIYPTGEVALCEFSRPAGKLQEHDYDFQSLWRSDGADAMRRATSRCWCTHGCYLSRNIEYSLAGQRAMLTRL